jgi:hypothetical protein
MARGKKALVAFVGLLLGVVFVCVYVVGLPTQAPPQYQIDMLSIAAAASVLVDEVSERGTPMTVQDLEAAKISSGGLIRSAEILSPTSIQVEAVMVPRSSGRVAAEGNRVPVLLKFELVPGQTEKSRVRALAARSRLFLRSAPRCEPER